MRDLLVWLVGNPADRSESFLRQYERRAVELILPKLPERFEPTHLSLIGAAGALLAAAAVLTSHRWIGAMALVPPAMALNWLGLTVDLPFARSRGQEVPASSMVHHLGEIFSLLTIILAYGASPFLSMRSAAIIIVCFLLFSAYGYIRATTRHFEQMTYIGIGMTEFRILLAAWPLAAVLLGVPDHLGDQLPPTDVAIMALAFFAIFGLVAKLFLDSRKITIASGGEHQ